MVIILSGSVRITAKLGDRAVPTRRHHNEVTVEAIETLAIVRSAASRVRLMRLEVRTTAWRRAEDIRHPAAQCPLRVSHDI